eukprot:TRINITY_DN12820_c0_g3_i1.p1 TRINITY_DN12820_c0_g3~~TRINITY_DN12820_c0_g3_i1.p1  ORF type:complete len:405 (+),score=80.10 TRINITY_DN12820_c0_g3_i1:92-1306(+)
MNNESTELPEEPLIDENLAKFDKGINEEDDVEGQSKELKDETKLSTRIVTTTIRDTNWRFAFLVLCCLVLMGSYYCYDNPAPVQRQIQAGIRNVVHGRVEYGMNMTTLQYQALYSLYSLPNIAIPLFGGFFIDRLGKKNGILVFASIVAVGQFFFAVSTHAVTANKGFGHFLALFGRFVFGLGGESLSVTQSALLAVWFKGKELSLAMGTDLCASRIFTVINDVTQPLFYEAGRYRLSLGFWFGFVLCIVSMGCAVPLLCLDNSAEQNSVQLQVPATEAETIDKDEDEYEDQLSFADLKLLGRIYWMLAASCVMVYMSFMSFMNVASDLLQTRFSLGSEAAGLVMSLPYLIAAIITPFVGYAIDLFGLKTIASSLLVMRSGLFICDICTVPSLLGSPRAVLARS